MECISPTPGGNKESIYLSTCTKTTYLNGTVFVHLPSGCEKKNVNKTNSNKHARSENMSSEDSSHNYIN